jgi:3'(2'), 5'-bisphosphate nucleotidase
VDKLINLALETAYLAGKEILNNYLRLSVIEKKKDESPLTFADRAAHELIISRLTESGLIVVSEEGDDLHLDAESYWLVDPLDGTKDFIAGNNEFTVNIALVEKSKPIFGIVFAPALDHLYWGGQGMGAKLLKDGVTRSLLPQDRSSFCKMAISRFHNHPDVEEFAIQNSISQKVAIGSALKYGLLAAGEVDVFPRLVGSSEWDTAAGQALLESVGGIVIDWHTKKPLNYGKKNRRNPRLLAMRAPYVPEEFRLKLYSGELL